MAIVLASRTMKAIEDQITSDQGAAFRVALGQVIPHMKDAYQGANEGFRTHLGASVLGQTCARQLWYGWRWALKPKFPARILRLFNRGHLEEARFIAMFLAIGCQVIQQDAQGKQFRISELGGHLGGAGDGVVIGIPDLSPGTPCLLEFKTHGEKSFLKLLKEGVRVSKFEHYVQMNIYMRKMGLMHALYGAVNKNTDEIYLELLTLDFQTADDFLDRGRQIIMLRSMPERMHGASIGGFACKFCDNKEMCFKNAPKARNCRTCFYAVPREDGTWWCESKERQMAMLFDGCKESDKKNGETYQLDKERQLTACESFYTPI